VKKISLIFPLILLFIFQINLAQEKTKIKIERAGFFEKDKIKYPDASVLTRDSKNQVLISHDGVLMSCNQAFFYEEKNFIEAYGDVVLKQGDTLDLEANFIEYNGDSRIILAKGNVILNEPESKLYTESLSFDRNKQEGYYTNNGKLIRNLTDTIISVIGTFYAEEKKYRFKKNVDLKTPKYKIYSDLLNYYTESGKSYFYGPTDIYTDDSKIYCEIGFYDTTNDNGYFIKNSEIDFEEYKINGDSIYFNKLTNYASATNNIKILDTINKTLTTGHYAEIYRKLDSMHIKKRALISSFKEKDTTHIHGESIIITGKEGEQIIRAFNNGKILRNTLSGKCDSIHYDQVSGIAQLINNKNNLLKKSRKIKKPILWNNKSQITGDSIHIKFDTENNIIDSLYVFDNAFIIEKDTLDLGYNQISGKKLFGNFIEGKLKFIDIIKNAESVYYLRNSENELIGIDKSKSAKINILIEQQEIETFTKINQIDGKVFPEEDFNENDKFLKGFYFREDERIETLEDLFKEDLKYELIKINQLQN
tara:strand:+ start:670 stop:2274 length:1605 start_codon:yes stop_codon:yes gene_type:complete